MAAFSAIRSNKIFKAFYERLIEKGKKIQSRSRGDNEKNDYRFERYDQNKYSMEGTTGFSRNFLNKKCGFTPKKI